MAGHMKLTVYQTRYADYAPSAGGWAATLACDVGDSDDSLQRVSDIAVGWFGQYSAPGYMDQTEPSGPYETATEAAEETFKMFGEESFDSDPSPDEIELGELLSRIREEESAP